MTRNLNKIIDVNYYPVETARRSNMRHRPIGMGVQVSHATLRRNPKTIPYLYRRTPVSASLPRPCQPHVRALWAAIWLAPAVPHAFWGLT